MNIDIFKERALISGMSEYVHTVERILNHLASFHYNSLVSQLCDKSEPVSQALLNPTPHITYKTDGSAMSIMFMVEYMEHPKKPKDRFQMRLTLRKSGDVPDYSKELALSLCRCFRYRGFDVFTNPEDSADIYIQFDIYANVPYHGNRRFV